MNILNSYNKNKGKLSNIWLVISGPGVTIPAIIKVTTIACLRYFFMNFGVNNPSRERKYEIIGISNTIPEVMIIDIIKLKYSLMAILLVISVVPKDAKNFNAVGIIMKYANAPPPIKQNEVKKTIHQI